jgi:hypothetical protein
MSLTIAGLIVLVLSYLAKASGYDLHVNEADISHVLTTTLEIVGLVMTYAGRIRQGDINIFGVKRLSPHPPLMALRAAVVANGKVLSALQPATNVKYSQQILPALLAYHNEPADKEA